MNKKQKIALLAAIVTIALMVMFPPIRPLDATLATNDIGVIRCVVVGFVGSYGFIINDFENIQYGLLSIQLVIVAAIAAGFIYVLRNCKDTQIKANERSKYRQCTSDET